MSQSNGKDERPTDQIRGREPTPAEQKVGEAIQHAGGDPRAGLPHVQGFGDALERIKAIIPGANARQRKALADELKQIVDQALQ